MTRVAALIPAAGKADRFDGCKHLALYQGKPVLQHVVDSSRELFNSDVFVVTGHYHKEISQSGMAAQWIYNPDYEQGLSSSIKCGVLALTGKFDAILIVLGDQVKITSKQLRLLSDRYVPESVVCARYPEGNGVPALFPKKYFGLLQTLDGDQGAKALLNNRMDGVSISVTSMDVDGAEKDIDRRVDLLRSDLV